MNAIEELEKIARTGITSTEDAKVEPVPLNAIANDYCGSSHLRAADLDGDTIVTVAGMDEVSFKDDTRPKLALSFKELNQALILNVTNTKTIAELHGAEIASWHGKKLTLYLSKVPFDGKIVDSIRIRA